MRQLLASQFRRNFASSLPATGLNVLLAAIAYAVYLNLLGYRRYGLWLVLAMVLSESQILKAGVSPAQVKLVAESHATGDLDLVRRYIGSSLLVLVAASLPVPVLVFALRHGLVSLFRLQADDAAVFLQLIGPMMVFLVYILAVDSLSAAIGGLGRMDLTNYLTAATQAVAVVVSGVLLWLGFGIRGLLAGQVVAYIFLHAWVLIILRRTCGFRFRDQFRWNGAAARTVARTGSWLFGSTLVNLLLDPVNRVLLTRYAGLGSVPVYDISFNAGMKLRSFADAATRALTPEVARIGALNEPGAGERIARINRRAMLLVTAGCAAVFLAVGLGAAPLLKLLLRARYSPELLGPVRIMLVAALFSAAGLAGFYTLTGLGRTRALLAGYAIQSVTSIAVIGCILAVTGKLTAVNVVTAFAAGTFTANLYINLVTRALLRRWPVTLPHVGL